MIKACIDSFCDLLYPPLCLHCQSALEDRTLTFCSLCALQLQLIDPKERCPFCFSIDYCFEQRSCSTCRNKASSLYRVGAAFDYLGPAATLIRKLKYGSQPHLAKSAAALLIAQWGQMEWPLPDILVPVPISFTHWLTRGYNQSLLLATEMSEWLDRPVQTPLKRSSGDYSQAGMNAEQRRLLSSGNLKLAKKHQLYDKTILLVDDVMTTGSTLQRCSETLAEGYPGKIYGLAFCMALN